VKGRKPKPAEIRELQGNPRRVPIPKVPKGEPIVQGLPPPSWLDAEAKKEWRSVVAQYADMKIITRNDIALLTAWCDTWSKWLAVTKKIKGRFVIGDGSGAKRNPLTTIEKDLKADLLTLAARFGFSPVDRMKLAIPPEKPPEENDIEAFLNKNRKKA